MKHATLAAEPRTVLGKKVAKMRRAGKLPANIYGHNVASTAITLDAHDFGLLYRHLLPTTIIDIALDGQSRPVLLAKTTTSPRSGRPIHIEFKQVNLREKVTAAVAIVGVGESELLARGEAVLLQSLDSVQVSALPDDLPADIEVSLSALVDFESAIHVDDLVVDRSKIDVLTPRDELVFKLTPPQMRDVEAEEQAEAAEAEAQSMASQAEEGGDTE